MEQPSPLPANDEWIDAQAGDLILYQGNQLVIYYGANSWSLTRLGRIEGVGAHMGKPAVPGRPVPVLYPRWDKHHAAGVQRPRLPAPHLAKEHVVIQMGGQAMACPLLLCAERARMSRR